MTFTEQQLRESLRRTTTEVPDAGDRVAQVQQRVRRRRQRTVAAVAGAAALVVLAVPVARALADRQARVDASSPGVAQEMDASMKYAAFVAWWDGLTVGLTRPVGWDAGVDGVSVSTTRPPTSCAVVTPAPGEPAGTQPAWVFGEGSVLSAAGGSFGIITSYQLWPTGVTSCDPRPSGAALADPPATPTTMRAAGHAAFASLLDDPSRPALDVESVYRAVPPERLTQHGRDVFDAYQAAVPTDYGTSRAQLDRVLAVLGSWIGIAMTNQVLAQQSPQTGPAMLTGDSYVGTAQLPSGYSARWDAAAGTVCVEGRLGDSGPRHVSNANFWAAVELGTTATADDGACPAE